MYYAIDDGNGDQITTGLRACEAQRVAQRIADERGDSVWLYEVGSDAPADEIAPAVQS